MDDARSSVDVSTEVDDDDSSTVDQLPFSTNARKRRIEELELGLQSGEIVEKKFTVDFNQFTDVSENVVDRLRCLKCNQFLSSKYGGNRTKHRKGDCVKNSEKSIKRITTEEISKAKQAVVKYVLRSGASFNHVESDSFREMVKAFLGIGTSNIDVDSFRLPSQEWIRKEAEKEGYAIISQIAEEIAEPIRKNECCLVLDFGKKVYNFLSVFVAFIDRQQDIPKLRCRPLMFMPVFEEKKAENIVEFLVEGGARVNLSRDQVLQMRVVGDGASNIKKLGDFFKSYSLCSCHSLSKAAERVLTPLNNYHIHFDPAELAHLKEIDGIVDICGDLATTIRRNRTTIQLEKLPVAYCQTRWLTFISCCQDIIELFPSIEKINHSRIRELREKLRPKLPQLMSAIQLLKLFEHPLKIFEQTEMRIHEVAPWLFKLQGIFKEQHEKGKESHDYTLEVVSKSASLSIEHYISMTLSDPHLLASFLCPGMRKLSMLPAEWREKTMKLVEEEIEMLVLDDDTSSASANGSSSLDHDLYDAPPPQPSASFELDDYRSSVFPTDDTFLPPIQFWHKHHQRFPRLSTIAGGVYCVLSSESICERAFSALNRVFRYDRQSMDPELVELLMISFLYLNDSS